MNQAFAPAPRRGLAIASLVLGIVGLFTLGIVGIGALVGIVLGVVALVKAGREPAVYGGKGMAVAGIALCVLSVVVMPFILGIGAAIAIPSLLRARVSANEAATIGDIRTVISAQAAYSTGNGGFYDRLDCLAAPANCIQSYSGGPVLDAQLAQAQVKSGYRRTFHPRPVEPGLLPPSVSRSSLSAYAYVAVPETRNRTGVRSFCGDATGRICYEPDGSDIQVEDGLCPSDCSDLR
jgi:type II secretory pathway pseudopilin PulG